jgi:DNA-binding CsgD family transcriptional regulator
MKEPPPMPPSATETDNSPLETSREVSLISSAAQDRMLRTLLDLQAAAPFALAALTVRRRPRGSDEVLRSYGMTREHIEDGLSEFIPESRYFRQVTQQPTDILDWTVVPEFSDSLMARDHLLSVGITQGMSFVLMHQDRIVGSAHFNFADIHSFTDEQYRALDQTRRHLAEDVGAYVVAGDVGLTRREREVLRLLAHGATNTEIGDAFHIATSTVKAHVESILAKLRVSNRIQATRAAVLLGLA